MTIDLSKLGNLVPKNTLLQIRNKFPWRIFPHFAVVLKLTMFGWPMSITWVPGADFQVNQLSKADWKLLYDLSNQGVFKIQAWSEGML